MLDFNIWGLFSAVVVNSHINTLLLHGGKKNMCYLFIEDTLVPCLESTVLQLEVIRIKS